MLIYAFEDTAVKADFHGTSDNNDELD